MGVGVVVFWCVLSTIHVDTVLLSGMSGAGSEARCKVLLHFIAEYCADWQRGKSMFPVLGSAERRTWPRPL